MSCCEICPRCCAVAVLPRRTTAKTTSESKRFIFNPPAALNLLPAAALSRSKESVNDLHVGDRIVDWVFEGVAGPDCTGEGLALQVVLIDDGERSPLSRTAVQ